MNYIARITNNTDSVMVLIWNVAEGSYKASIDVGATKNIAFASEAHFKACMDQNARGFSEGKLTLVEKEQPRVEIIDTEVAVAPRKKRSYK